MSAKGSAAKIRGRILGANKVPKSNRAAEFHSSGAPTKIQMRLVEETIARLKRQNPRNVQNVDILSKEIAKAANLKHNEAYRIAVRISALAKKEGLK